METDSNKDCNNMENQENTRRENEKLQDEKISEYGQVMLDNNEKANKIHLLSIVGEIEGHENLPSGSKSDFFRDAAVAYDQAPDQSALSLIDGFRKIDYFSRNRFHDSAFREFDNRSQL